MRAKNALGSDAPAMADRPASLAVLEGPNCHGVSR
jgi:hypothetical protein